jgi:AraC family transcriptional regulator
MVLVTGILNFSGDLLPFFRFGGASPVISASISMKGTFSYRNVDFVRMHAATLDQEPDSKKDQEILSAARYTRSFMAVAFAEMQRVLAYVSAHLDGDVSLKRLAGKAGLSPFYLHREFSEAIGETPGKVALRLRLVRGGALLLTTKDSVLDVALASGFRNHETFSRAFRRQFGMAPRAYRKRGFAHDPGASETAEHAVLAEHVAVCLRLYRREQRSEWKRSPMVYTVTNKELAPQPVLTARRRVKRSAIAATIGETLGQVFAYAQQHGIAFAGLPLTRYIEIEFGMVTMEPAMRIAGPMAGGPADSAQGVVIAELPGGMAATTMHVGPYEGLPDAYAAIQEWMESEGLKPAGAPWECYVNDPGEFPDSKDWKTEVFWPVAVAG